MFGGSKINIMGIKINTSVASIRIQYKIRPQKKKKKNPTKDYLQDLIWSYRVYPNKLLITIYLDLFDLY